MAVCNLCASASGRRSRSVGCAGFAGVNVHKLAALFAFGRLCSVVKVAHRRLCLQLALQCCATVCRRGRFLVAGCSGRVTHSRIKALRCISRVLGCAFGGCSGRSMQKQALAFGRLCGFCRRKCAKAGGRARVRSVVLGRGVGVKPCSLQSQRRFLCCLQLQTVC